VFGCEVAVACLGVVVVEPSSFILLGQKRLVTARARPTSKGEAIDNPYGTGLGMRQWK